MSLGSESELAYCPNLKKVECHLRHFSIEHNPIKINDSYYLRIIKLYVS